jgi:hypothetical protein
MRFINKLILWFVLGGVLISAKTSPESTLTFDNIYNSSIAIDESKADFDGPHIFYKNDTTFIKQVYRKDTVAYGSIDTVYGSIKGRPINCFINDSLFFRTKIKNSLELEQSKYSEPEKIIAISDIEGNFLVLRDFLINNGVINIENQWIFGNGHLVLAGDFFDRGLNVTECLWFIYHLEQEAVKNGGYVHFILGNHEIMNMNEDFRYVRRKYFYNTYLIKENYKNWYTLNTELGRWLQTKNIVEKIGDYLFIHGGVSEEINGLGPSIKKINRVARKYYYNDLIASESDNSLVNTLYNSKTSPFWYRGYIKESTSQEEVDITLKKYAVKRIVVGHSVVRDVSYFYDKKVIGIDTRHSKGDAEGLLIKYGKEFRIDKYGAQYQIK